MFNPDTIPAGDDIHMSPNEMLAFLADDDIDDDEVRRTLVDTFGADAGPWFDQVLADAKGDAIVADVLGWLDQFNADPMAQAMTELGEEFEHEDDADTEIRRQMVEQFGEAGGKYFDERLAEADA